MKGLHKNYQIYQPFSVIFFPSLLLRVILLFFSKVVSFRDYELLNALNLFLVYFFSKFCVIYKEVFIFKKYNIINLALEHQVKAEKILFNQGY